MKKLLALLLAFSMVFTMTACGSKKEETAVEPGSGKIKIGVMQFGEFTALQNCFEGFKAGIEEAGLDVEFNYLSAAADTANCPTIADTLINDGSDLIFAIATPSVSCIKEKTSEIPVLFSAVTDPVASGLVVDANKPGANISGTSDMNPVKEQIDLLKEIIPDAKTVAVFYCSSESNSAAQFELAKAEIEALGMTCVQKTISAIDEAKSAIESLNGQIDAMYIPTDNTLADSMTLVAQVAIENNIPVICGEPGQVEAGGLATFGINYFELGKQTAKMAVEVLTSQDPLAAVANMPVGFQTENCTRAINKTTAEKLGIQIPEQIIRSAEVFE